MVERKNETVLNPVPLTHGKSVQNWTNQTLSLGRMMSEKNDENRQINEHSSIDSCMLFIPAKKCTYIDEALKRLTVLVEADSDTGELVDTVGELRGQAAQRRAISYKRNGITYTFGYKERMQLRGKNAAEKVEYIACAVSSKMLQGLYLKGINNDTIEALYTNIIEQGLFKCSFDTFLDCKVSDMDIKRDSYIETKQLTTFIKSMYEAVKPEYKKVTVNEFNKSKRNEGLQVGKRGDKAVSLLKFYWKSAELVRNSYEFNDEYVGMPLEENKKTVIRMELTVNGEKEAKRIGLITKSEQLTMRKMLQLIDRKSEINRIFVDVINERFNKVEEKSNDMTASNLDIKDSNFPQSKGAAIYSACYTMANGSDASLDLCKNVANIILDCSEAKKKRFLPIAYDIAERAYNDAKAQAAGKSLSDEIKQSVLGSFNLFGLQ